MRVLVTGGARFIDSHLVKRLLRDGHDVVVADNFLTGRAENVDQVSGRAALRVIPEDMSQSLPADDPQRRKPDIAKARQLLGWQPATSLDVGLGKTIQFFREGLADPDAP